MLSGATVMRLLRSLAMLIAIVIGDRLARAQYHGVRQSDTTNFTRFIPVLPVGTSPNCVRIDLNGSVDLRSMVPDNTCSTTRRGHFSVAIESTVPSLGMAVLLPPTPAGGSKKISQRVAWIGGSVIGSSAVDSSNIVGIEGEETQAKDRHSEDGESGRSRGSPSSVSSGRNESLVGYSDKNPTAAGEHENVRTLRKIRIRNPECCIVVHIGRKFHLLVIHLNEFGLKSKDENP
ncbi:hypothetical protein MLD38_023948 [Melastoma candidum]|uniref:Uncharacterized protein n=1 Tax=Melastoma candidum TaxID=119954 RepID=A0ACB9NSC5_9MYRT|nr:hypothetical protein MLD38_023948 [Melastoma candidum]